MRPHKALLGSFAVAVAVGDDDAVAFAVAVAVAVAVAEGGQEGGQGDSGYL